MFRLDDYTVCLVTERHLVVDLFRSLFRLLDTIFRCLQCLRYPWLRPTLTDRFSLAGQPVHKFALIADCGRSAAELCRALHRRGKHNNAGSTPVCD